MGGVSTGGVNRSHHAGGTGGAAVQALAGKDAAGSGYQRSSPESRHILPGNSQAEYENKAEGLLVLASRGLSITQLSCAVLWAES